MHGTEALGRPFQYQLELLSENSGINGSKLVGQRMTVHLQIAGKAVRHFNGVVASFAYAGEHGQHSVYHATLRPWFWLLSQRVENQVQQRITVPELAALLFRVNGFTDVEPPALSGEYQKREYIVQYQESVLSFVSRWLEYEGIYYSFKHEEDAHKICLADSSTTGQEVAAYEELPLIAPTHSGREALDHFESWREIRSVVPSSFALDSFDYQKPKADLFVSNPVSADTMSEGRIFHAPDKYVESEVGQTTARIRGEELRAGEVIFEGTGNVRGLVPGALFTLKDHKRKDMNKKYCVIAQEIAIHAGEFTSGGGGDVQVRTSVRAIDADTRFRPARVTPRPTVSGPQTATVVGVKGSEIDSEELGRIRIQFHWDQENNYDQDSSCWVRVAQPWAGADFGVQFIPRVGQEVLVDFIDGDPDQPIVLGSVYNRNHLPPYPANKHPTQSGIRTRSSEGGGPDDYNELRFEDKKGKEEVHLQAQRDLTAVVKNDYSGTIGANYTRHVKRNQTVQLAEGHYRIDVKKGEMYSSVAETCAVQAKTIEQVASDGIVLKVGDVSITIDGQSIALTVGATRIKLDQTSLLLLAPKIDINPPAAPPEPPIQLSSTLAGKGEASSSSHAESS
jgi:type VI secretion system secreted protein VgrG